MKTKIVAAIILLIVGLGIFYFLKEQNAKLLFSLQKQCKEEGEKTREEWVKKYFGDQFSDEPIYHYNQKLNSCLYADDYIGPTLLSGRPIAAGHIYFVLDVHSNQILLEYDSRNGQQISNEAKKKELLTQ